MPVLNTSKEDIMPEFVLELVFKYQQYLVLQAILVGLVLLLCAFPPYREKKEA
jgi:hypothetical protein